MTYHFFPGLKSLCSLGMAAALLSLSAATVAADATPGMVDVLILGDAASEKAHHFEGVDTQATVGALGEPARVSLPKTPADYYGGDLSFDMAVDPVKQNYVSVKFWGRTSTAGRRRCCTSTANSSATGTWATTRRSTTAPTCPRSGAASFTTPTSCRSR